MKRGHKPKYKTKKQKEAAKKAYARAYYLEHRGELKKTTSANPVDISPLEARIAALETEIKELKLDFDEVLKDNKKLADLIKWGKQ